MTITGAATVGRSSADLLPVRVFGRGQARWWCLARAPGRLGYRLGQELLIVRLVVRIVQQIVIVRRRPKRTVGSTPVTTTEVIAPLRLMTSTTPGVFEASFNVTGSSIGPNNKALIRVVALLDNGRIAIVDGPPRAHPP